MLQDMHSYANRQNFIAVYQVNEPAAGPCDSLTERSHMDTLLDKLRNVAEDNLGNSYLSHLWLFKYRNAFFLLLGGKDILISGWSSRLQRSLEVSINQSCGRGNRVTLTDLTYSEAANSRRLHSLGGGLRRVIAVVRGEMPHFTVKQVHTDTKLLSPRDVCVELESVAVVGSQEELHVSLFAVQKNAKKYGKAQELAEQLERAQDEVGMYR